MKTKGDGIYEHAFLNHSSHFIILVEKKDDNDDNTFWNLLQG